MARATGAINSVPDRARDPGSGPRPTVIAIRANEQPPATRLRQKGSTMDWSIPEDVTTFVQNLDHFIERVPQVRRRGNRQHRWPLERRPGFSWLRISSATPPENDRQDDRCRGKTRPPQ